MIKIIKAGALAIGVAACFVMAQAAEAGTLNLTRDTTNFTGGVGGGEFGISNFTGGTIATANPPMKVTGYDFQSFCMQGASVLNGVQPFTWILSTKVDLVGKDLTAGAAYLYTNFWNGTGFNETGVGFFGTNPASTNYTFTYNYTLGSGRTTSADDLQEAIWWYQTEWQNGFQNAGEFAALSANAKALVDAAAVATSSGGSWFNQFGANGIGAARILVLFDKNGAPQQDILVLVAVPLPSSALLGLGLMTGLGVVSLVRRRRRNVLA